MQTKGLFITVEGVDGAGKSTAMEWLAEQIAAQRTIVRTREPGGTALGERLRELLLHEKMDLETETLLMFAARREHIAQVILPALARGDVVISDRFTDATFAYQGGGRGVGFDKVLILENWVQGELQPDLTLLFDVPLDIARARIAARAEQTNEALDKFENESFEFFRRTRDAYFRRAEAAPQRIAIIDSTQSLDDVKRQISQAIAQRVHLNLHITP
ncbi:MAG: tmk 2 [Burkholderiaceae bacterium]|nr:tmk 2 [Burkholderiaceae bacterium]